MRPKLHRWVENVPVIERVIDILPSLKRYVKCEDDEKLKSPGRKSFEMEKMTCRDPCYRRETAFRPDSCQVLAAILETLIRLTNP